MTVHLCKHTSYLPDIGERFVSSNLTNFMMFLSGVRNHFTEEFMIASYNSVVENPKFLEGKLHEEGCSIGDEVEGILLTELWTGENHEWEQKRGPYPEGKLYETFDVPKVVDSGVFSYYAKDEWTVRQVKKAMKSKRTPMNPLLEAAILQGLFIH